MKTLKLAVLAALVVTVIGGMGFGQAPEQNQNHQRALLTVTPTELDFGQLNTRLQQSPTKVMQFRVKNIGNIPVSLLFTRPQKPFTIRSIFTPGDTGQLPVGQTAIISIQYRPTTGGVFSDFITVSARHVVGFAQQVTLLGVANKPAFELETTELNFGSVGVLIDSDNPINSLISERPSKTMTLAVRNIGETMLTGRLTFRANAYIMGTPEVLGLTFGLDIYRRYSIFFSLQPGEFEEFTFTFIPPSRGTFDTPITIRTNDANARRVTVRLVGQGVSPEIGVSPVSLNFSDVTVTGQATIPTIGETKNFQVNNTGIDPLEVQVESTCPGYTTNLEQVSNGLAFMNPGQSVTVRVTFTPTLPGNYDCAIIVRSNDATDPSIRVLMFGTAVVPSPRSASLGIAQAAPVALSRAQAVPMASGFRFQTQGAGIQALQVQVYNLQGQAIFDSGMVSGNQLSWQAADAFGARLANGTYLYVVTAQGAAGDLAHSKVHKLYMLN